MASRKGSETVPCISLEVQERTGRALPRLLRMGLVGIGLNVIGTLILLASTVWAQDTKVSSASSPSRRIPDELNFAHGLFRQCKFDLAAEEYQRFLDKGPSGSDADDARFGLASAHLFQGRYKEARRDFEDFLARAPRHARARTAWYRVGELSYMLGDLPRARKALETFVKGPSSHPNLETAWTYLGDVCLGLEDQVAARSAYERSLADFPRGQLADRARYGLGRTLAGLGEADSAVKILSELARGGGSDWVDRAWLQVGKIQISTGRHAAAVESLEELERAAPRSALRPEARLQRAAALTRLDRSTEAERLLVPLIDEAAPSVAPQAALALATIQLEHAKPDKALTTLNDALERFPQSPLVPALLFRSAEALEKQKRSGQARERFLKVAEIDPRDPSAADAVVRAAQLALEAGDHAGARQLAESFGKRFPESKLKADIRLIEARSFLAGGQPEEAARLLEELLGISQERSLEGKSQASPLSPAATAAARYDLAVAYRGTRQAALADAMLAGLADSSKGAVGADAQFLIGQEHVEKGRYAEALTPLNHYLSANPGGGVADYALAHLATAQLGLGQIADAWTTVAQLADRFPRSKALPSTRLRLGEAALDADQADRAAEQFRLVLGPDPGGRGSASGSNKSTSGAIDQSIRPRAQAGLGRALWKLGKPADAATVFAQLLETFPDSPNVPQVALDRAGALEASGQHDTALAAYGQVSDRYPKTKEALRAELARARLLAKIGRSADAGTTFMKLLFERRSRSQLGSLGETPDGLLAELGWALVDAQQTDEADQIFAELLEAYPESPSAADARFNLAESANQARNFAEVIRLLSPLVTPSAISEKNQRNPAQGTASRRLMPLILYRLGRTQMELGDWAAGTATMDRLLAEYPKSPRRREALFLRAEAALRQDDAAAAEATFSTLVAEPSSSSDPKGFVQLVRGRHVQSLLGLKRWKDALTKAESLESELSHDDPAVAELDFARGRALLGLARPEEARTALQAVIDARKGGDLAAQAQLMVGETFFHQNRFREAVREFWRVDILHNDAPKWQAAALLEAGKVYERLGQWLDAAQTYESLCSRFPQDPHIAEAQSRLAAVRKHNSVRGQAGAKVF
jgi:cellulose synthase operon protein C